MSMVEEGYLDFSTKARHAYAGFASSYTITEYAKIQIGNKSESFSTFPLSRESSRGFQASFKCWEGPRLARLRW
jgi:hypothetical protein